MNDDDIRSFVLQLHDYLALIGYPLNEDQDFDDLMNFCLDNIDSTGPGNMN